MDWHKVLCQVKSDIIGSTAWYHSVCVCVKIAICQAPTTCQILAQHFCIFHHLIFTKHKKKLFYSK